MKDMGAGYAAALALVVLGMFGCAPSPERPPPAPEQLLPTGYPLGIYQQALAQGLDVYRVLPERSEIVVRVYRGGSLARMGHNHTVASRDVRGHVLLAKNFGDSRFDLYFPVTSLIVDDPADRAKAGAGFDTEPSDKAIEGTRGNLLGPSQLDAADYPFISIAGTVADGVPPRPELHVALSVRGVTTERVTPVELRREGDLLIASGKLSLRLSELGIEPYSVLGGALKVQDAMDLNFRIMATSMRPGSG